MTTPNRYEEQAPLTEDQLAELKSILDKRRSKIVSEEEEQIEAAKGDETILRMSDEVDLASAEYDQAFEFRMRDREKHLLKKVEHALERIDEGTYGECESCGNYIGYKRLSARPEATLCIECKEEQERVEKHFKKKRQQETQFPFK